MKTYPGLKFVIVIAGMLGLAVGCRTNLPNVFTGYPYVLVLDHVSVLSGNEAAFRKLVAAHSAKSDFSWQIPKQGAPQPPPHITQQIAFSAAKDLKAVTDALVSSGARMQVHSKSTSVVTPQGSPPPPPQPHITQTAGLETPKSDEAVVAALRR